MPKLIRATEGAGCGATIELDSGELVFVSIAQIGVLVRKIETSRGLIRAIWTNFFGPNLYDEKNVYRNAQTAISLKAKYPDVPPALNFNNPVLASFANAIWHCKTAAEICVVLNEANL